MARTKPAHGTAMLAGLFAAGLLITAFAWVDVEWTHWLFVKDRPWFRKAPSVDPQQVQKLRQSILNIRATCDGRSEHSGTAFVAKPGYVATAAHMFGDDQQC